MTLIERAGETDEYPLSHCRYCVADPLPAWPEVQNRYRNKTIQQHPPRSERRKRIWARSDQADNLRCLRADSSLIYVNPRFDPLWFNQPKHGYTA